MLNEIMDVDGDQDMLPQNMASWHIEYFKIKESEKNDRSRKVCLTSPQPHPSPLKQVIDSHVSSPYLEQRSTLISRGEGGSQEESKQIDLARLPRSTTLSSNSLSYHISLHQIYYKNTQV